MRIKMWASNDPEHPDFGPYRFLDEVEEDSLYSIGEATDFGQVIAILPSIPPFVNDVDQSVLVKVDPGNQTTRAVKSVFGHLPSSYERFNFVPISVDRFNHDVPSGTFKILPSESLTIEDVSHFITPNTFSIWKHDCMLSKSTVNDLEGVTYAIVHRYSTTTYQEGALEEQSDHFLNLTTACLALIRPTKRWRAHIIRGVIEVDRTFDPRGFQLQEPVEVPNVQRFFAIRRRDIDLLCTVLPEFMQLYQKDDLGRLKDDYEPIRMAVQLYEQAYAISYWKARHILWWAAIEALYGNNEDAIIARIYAFFGDHDLRRGYDRSIYEKGDIPSWTVVTPDNNHTLGEVVPFIYKVRNSSAHGQRVEDPNFIDVPHPLNEKTPLIEILAEAATLIIRNTVIEMLRRGLRDNFKNRQTREAFWLYKYGLDAKQSKKQLKALAEVLRLRNGIGDGLHE
jgi:hypothetical protein